MAYLNEFPHFDSNKLNLDWLYEQYTTFEERIQEIKDHFDEVAEEMRADQEVFKREINSAVTNLTNAWNDFQTSINNQFSSLSTELRNEIATLNSQLEANIQELAATLTNEVDSSVEYINGRLDIITNNMIDYVREHMSEWQASASINGNRLMLSNESSPTYNKSNISQIQLDGEYHNFEAYSKGLNAQYVSGTHQVTINIPMYEYLNNFNSNFTNNTRLLKLLYMKAESVEEHFILLNNNNGTISIEATDIPSATTRAGELYNMSITQPNTYYLSTITINSYSESPGAGLIDGHFILIDELMSSYN